MKDVIIETDRLILTKLKRDDFDELSSFMKDIEVMYAWEKSFSDKEICDWIDRMNLNYEKYGYGYFLATDKTTNKVVGQIGLLQETIKDKEYVGVGYILKKDCWGKKFATEGAKGCIDYAFNVLKVREIVADIRPINQKSLMVANRLGMKVVGNYIKHYDGKDMLHDIYIIENPLYREVILKNGKTVIIREAEKKDAPKILEHSEEISGQTNFISFGPGEFNMSLEEEEEHLDKVFKKRNAIYILAICDKKIIGHLDFTTGKRPRLRHSGEFGISIHQDYWRMGVATLLLESLLEWAKFTGFVRKINLVVVKTNDKAISLYKKFGFEEEGVFTRDLYIDGIFYDAIHMGLKLD